MQVDPRGRRGDSPERGEERELAPRLDPKHTLRLQILADSLVVGGAERVLESLCLGFPEHDIRPSVATFRDPGPIGESLAAQGVEVTERVAPARRSLAQVGSLRTFLRRQRPHVVYCLDHSNVLWYGRLAAKLAGVKAQVVAVHRTRRADGQPSLGRTDRMLMGLTNRVIAVSQGHKDYLVSSEGLPERKVHVVHNGVDPSRFGPRLTGEALAAGRVRWGLPADQAVVGIVAALRPEKNHRLMFEALVRVPADQRPHLAIVGDGPMQARLADAVEELDLRRYVHWVGACDDVPAVLSVLDLLCLVSEPNVETFPMAILEAMATGLPVISTEVGSVAEMVVDGNTGILVPPGNPSALADSLQSVLGDPGRAAAMGAAGARRLSEEFPRTRMVQRTADLLWEVSGQRRRRPAGAGI